jgi:sugar phosphate isomerase/epimerase
MNVLSRRQFHRITTASALAAMGVRPAPKKPKRSICAFIKFIQKLSYDDLAETIAELGFQGIEATIRPGGLIEPEDAPEELPKLADALAKRDLEITVMTTSITNPDRELDQTLLKIAADLGIERYRMGYYKYDLSRHIRKQLDEFRPAIEKLAEFNRNTGITAVYQNHAGARNVGSTLWDLTELLRDIDPDQVGMAFDIRHAVASGGDSWPILWDIAKPHLRTVYVKDFAWENGRIKNVLLGEGMVPRDFMDSFTAIDSSTPISLHVEYLQKDGLRKNIDALGEDLAVLQNWMGNQ